MMGDDMAIRSGGMYGNPESPYTFARPSYSSLSGFTSTGGVFGKMASAGARYYYADKQVESDLKALNKERQYNIKNFQQYMADTLAKNKMSFYASGLDFSGTAFDVTMSNQRALEDELDIMKYNYKIKEKNIRNAEKANERQLISDMVNTFTGGF